MRFSPKAVGELVPVTDTPKAERPGEITEAFARFLERHAYLPPDYER